MLITGASGSGTTTLGKGVVSGSVVNWGTDIEDSFDLVVFLTVPAETRVERLRKRELARFGHGNNDFLEGPHSTTKDVWPEGV